MAEGLVISIVFIAFVAAGIAGYIFSPKGQDQVVWRTVIIMTLVCTWTMWAVTYLAQANPLIRPEKPLKHT
ncbi:ATPase, V0 complex, subunit E1/e2 [Cladochytrium replicatum]|nr:ATPase, V0 complex, subunit E1/e2 [Cladochytrium replicatum]